MESLAQNFMLTLMSVYFSFQCHTTYVGFFKSLTIPLSLPSTQQQYWDVSQQTYVTVVAI